jgi:D-alanyl-lipoteichoic acid acyltransferase DltB (MBOAT superfamily)
MMLATVGFAFQVYCDFSGYTDIAIGSARIFGVGLTQNFRQPYFATSIADFWKRWHITLSSWLTDYVYTPLTKSRVLQLPWYPKLLLCLLLTFLISGLWHGASAHFVLWGALHGLFLVGSVVTQRLRRNVVRTLRLDRVPALHTGVRIVSTFLLVCLTYIFFRAEQVSDAVYIVTHLFDGVPAFASHVAGGRWIDASRQLLLTRAPAEFTLAVMGVVIVLFVDAGVRWQWVTTPFVERPVLLRWSAYVALVFAVIVCGAFYDKQYTFIYFEF